jgi:hypothetical protein
MHSRQVYLALGRPLVPAYRGLSGALLVPRSAFHALSAPASKWRVVVCKRLFRDDLKARALKTKAIVMNTRYWIHLLLPRRFAPAFRTVIPARGAWPVKIAPSTPDAIARTSGTRTDRARATWDLCASTCTRDPRFARGSA